MYLPSTSQENIFYQTENIYLAIETNYMNVLIYVYRCTYVTLLHYKTLADVYLECFLSSAQYEGRQG